MHLVENGPDFAGQLGEQSPLGREIKEKLAECEAARTTVEPHWYMQREFLRGNHYATWFGGALQDLRRDAAAMRKPRLVFNQSRVIVETLLAYLLRSSPYFTALPESGNPEHLARALAARRVLYSYWYRLECDEKLERTGMWTLCTGIGVQKVTWDPMLGPRLTRTERRPMVGPVGADGQPVQLYQDVATGESPAGEVRIDVLSPFEFFLDPGAETLEDAQYAMHVTMRPVAELKRRYPALAERIVPEQGPVGRGYAGRSLVSHGASASFSSSRVRGRARVIEYWAIPTDEYPDGLRAVVLTAGVADAGPTPKGVAHLPFAVWQDRLVPGEFLADGTMRDILPLNKELDKRLSQAVDIANKFRVKYIVPIGSVDEAQITNEDGEIIEFEYGKPPVPSNPPPLPSSVVDLIKFTKDGSEEVSGALSVIQGKQHGEVRSGRQVAYLGQYGETRIGLHAKHLARFLSRLGSLVLKAVAANVTEPRLGLIVGPNREMETFYFKGADVENATTVRVETDSLLGLSKAERFDKLMRLGDAGIITKDRILSMLEMGDFMAAVEPKAQDRNVALRENETWRQGQVVRDPRAFEDHVEHLSTHDLFRKSTTYDALPEPRRMLVDAHCDIHAKFLMAVATPATPGSSPAQEPTPSPAPEVPAPESGPEAAEGLPPVPPVAPPGPGGP